MKPPRQGDSWGDSRPSNRIGLGHGQDRRSDPYQQQGSVWDNPGSGYGSSSWSQAPAPLYDSYDRYETPVPLARGPVPLAQPLSYRDDPYYAQPAPLAPAPLRSAYYDDVEPAYQQPAPYGSYSLADPIARPLSYDYGVSAPRYDRYERVERVERPPPRPLYDNRDRGFGGRAPSQSQGNNSFYGGRKENRSFGGPKGSPRGNPRKRERESSFNAPKYNRRSTSNNNGQRNGKSAKPNENKQESSEAKNERNDARFLFEKTDNAVELFSKCKNLGEARHRQFRYKLYRCLNTLGLEFITITEQQGTYAKTGTLKMKVTLKNFFPQFFVGEGDGTEHEATCYEATVNLALKLHENGLLSCETISNFYNKKLHYKPEKFDQAKAKFKMMIDEIEKHEFTAEFKEGKVDSDEQLELLKTCVKTVSDTIREEEAKQDASEGSTADAKANKNAESTESAEKPTTTAQDLEKSAVNPETEQESEKPVNAETKSDEAMECTDEA